MLLQLVPAVVPEVVRAAVPASSGPGEGLPEGQCTGPSARRAPGPEGSPLGLQVKPLRHSASSGQQWPAATTTNSAPKLRAARSTLLRLASSAAPQGRHSGRGDTRGRPRQQRTAQPHRAASPHRRASGLLPAHPPDQTASQGCSSLTESLGWAGRAGLPGCRRSAAPSHAAPCHAELCRAAPSRAHCHCGGWEGAGWEGKTGGAVPETPSDPSLQPSSSYSSSSSSRVHATLGRARRNGPFQDSRPIW